AEPVATTAADAFALHSDPGASYTIYLDFVGFKLSGTLWNTLANILMPAVTVPAWDPDGNGPGFASDELSRVQEIWQRIAADYAPFDVDVTTADPGSAALARSGSTDHQYGVRALFLGNDSASSIVYADVCKSSCGGIAFQPSFGSADLTPALIFAHSLGPNDPKYIADAASHEIGHTLGLSHDGLYPSGTSAHQEYYPGRAGWGPLMGDPYSMPMSQWSDGSYANASNTEDDVAILRNTLGLRPDESGDGPSAAAPLGGGGLITGRNDVDTYALGQCSGAVQLTAAPTAVGTDLDLDLRLLDAAGDVVAESDPGLQVKSYDTAGGLGASISADVAAGAYYVRVDGGGATANNPYDDYASLGAYRVSLAGGCAPSVAAGTPGAPQSVVATAATDRAAVTVRWQPPVDATGVTGYRVHLGASTITVGASARSHTFTGLALNTGYVATVAAVNGAGVGVPSGAAAHTAATLATAPGHVRDLGARWHAGGRYLRVHWRAPAYDGGTVITGYRVSVDGRVVGTVGPGRRAATVRNLHRGRHVVTVRALNAVGHSTAVRRAVRVRR
ncbi:MAG TPA: fibronectin type III domain-containing protein, partial [Nocardioides sp.]|nr:fibronectin type III domain-containing protein [Nocardioides sp.]